MPVYLEGDRIFRKPRKAKLVQSSGFEFCRYRDLEVIGVLYVMGDDTISLFVSLTSKQIARGLSSKVTDNLTGREIILTGPAINDAHIHHRSRFRRATRVIWEHES